MTPKLIAYSMPIWTKDARSSFKELPIPRSGKITVLAGQLTFIELTEEGEEIVSHLF